MSFPESPRVLYGKNPLDQVICQLRFPPVLRIDSELPATFQERVRSAYPYFEQKSAFDLGPDVPSEIARLLGASLPPGNSAVRYEFISDDRLRTATLTKDFLALSAREYTRWEIFEQQLNIPLSALLDLYSPAFYCRIGLRYRDLVRRSALGLEDVPWSKLLRSEILGELASADVAEDIESTMREVVLRLQNGSARVRVKHGLGQVEDTGEVCYMIDADFFTEERTEINNALSILRGFNRQAGHLFRWCVTERLHEAMEPRAIA
jgi:uncharacterized protein (TIGR04255 family)